MVAQAAGGDEGHADQDDGHHAGQDEDGQVAQGVVGAHGAAADGEEEPHHAEDGGQDVDVKGGAVLFHDQISSFFLSLEDRTYMAALPTITTAEMPAAA